jgi:prepilin-type N-terminal cleavage/methylation domain-containing protein
MRSRGYTLVELMVSLAIVGIVAAVALSTLRKSNEITSLQRADQDLRASVNNARRRAINRGLEFCLDVTAESVSYRCKSDVAGCSPAPATPPTTCSDGLEWESGVVRMWPIDIQALYYARAADLGTGVTKSSFTGTVTVTFKTDGSIDSDPDTDGQQGFTVYFRGIAGASLKRKVWIVAASGLPGSADQWE